MHNYYQYVETPELNGIADTLKNDLALNYAFKVGCTYGISLQKQFCQPFFVCTECNQQEDDENLVVCLMCAMICHAGHKLLPGNYGKDTKIVCDCGQGKFSKCEGLNSKCPVESFRGKRGC